MRASDFHRLPVKKLEHLGIACIQPGGARVAPLDEASLDIIGPMLDIDDLPNRQLLDDIMQVIDGLMRVAVEATVTQATDEQLQHLRNLAKPLPRRTLPKLFGKDGRSARTALFNASRKFETPLATPTDGLLRLFRAKGTASRHRNLQQPGLPGAGL